MFCGSVCKAQKSSSFLLFQLEFDSFIWEHSTNKLAQVQKKKKKKKKKKIAGNVFKGILQKLTLFYALIVSVVHQHGLTFKHVFIHTCNEIQEGFLRQIQLPTLCMTLY